MSGPDLTAREKSMLSAMLEQRNNFPVYEYRTSRENEALRQNAQNVPPHCREPQEV